MLCDEAFISSALDIPIEESHVSYNPSIAVRHCVDETHNLWSKVVDLERCDRADLSALFANLKFLRNLSSVLQRKNGDEDIIVSVPNRIEIGDTLLTISYELNPLGSVYDVSNRLGGLSEETTAAVIARAIVCLDKLHACGVIHRELCAKHLLVTDHDSVKLCGLGSIAEFPLSPTLAAPNDLPPVHLSWRGWNVNASTHPMAWYAPEIIGQDFTGYSWAADIYSLGLTLWELYTGTSPFNNLSPTEILLRKLSDSEPPKLGNLRPNSPPPGQAMLDLYYACTEYDASKRPTTQDLLQMPWIQWGLQNSLLALISQSATS